MSWIDLLVLLIMVAMAALGVRQGLIGGLADLLALVVALLIALAISGAGASALRAVGVGPRVAPMAALLLVLFAVHAGMTWLMHRPVKKAYEAVGDASWHRAAGAGPGLVKGVLFSAALLFVVVRLPSDRAPKPAIERSFAGPPLVSFLQGVLTLGTEHLRGMKGIVGLQILPEGQDREDLHFRAEHLVMRPDIEERLVALVNAERAQRGLEPYELDADLRAVARAHSEDMWRRGYFGHFDPEGRSHGDRLAAAHITRTSSAENVALAPGVDLLHEGLMDSPGHRANILAPEFKRIGIGVYHSPVMGFMATQLFSE